MPVGYQPVWNCDQKSAQPQDFGTLYFISKDEQL
jgi:hypothetical protein